MEPTTGHPHPVGTCITSDDQIARIEELAHREKNNAAVLMCDPVTLTFRHAAL